MAARLTMSGVYGFASFLKQTRHVSCKKFLMMQHVNSRRLFFGTDSEDISANPFYEKYAGKISNVNVKKHRSSEKKTIPSNRSQEKSSSKIYDRVLDKEIFDVKSKIQKKSILADTNTVSSSSVSGSKSIYDKGLAGIMHLDKVEKQSAQTIEELWTKFHENKDCVSAVLPVSMYDLISERARKYPLFLYPLLREHGYEFMVGEFSNNQCYITSVLNYQTLKENAPWVMAFTHFTELKDTKGVVLMVGEIDTNVVKTQDAAFIANLIQLYYGTDDQYKLDLLKTFNTQPDKFDHMSVVKELERSIQSG